MLRLYARLSPAQQQALRAGKPLPTATGRKVGLNEGPTKRR